MLVGFFRPFGKPLTTFRTTSNNIEQHRTISNHFQQLTFRFPWRAYQQRVLTGLDEFLDDRKLHLVAPPGSGKTVIGLEVLRRLNHPALVLAPTIALREQWVDRFVHDFLQTDVRPDWISTNLRKPGILTVGTYQGLHALDETEFRAFRDAKIGTLVVDEAHHLKRSWWKKLTTLHRILDPTLVALTATPPYDAASDEWARYHEFCGPIDLEISTPELVRAGDLCPHQDLVYTVLPDPDLLAGLRKFRERAAAFFEEICADDTLRFAVQYFEPLHVPDEWTYANVPTAVAMLSYLDRRDRPAHETHTEEVTGSPLELPKFDLAWAERLLDWYLFDDSPHLRLFNWHREGWLHRARRQGLTRRNRLQLREPPAAERLLGAARARLQATQRIVHETHAHEGDATRCLVLTDFVRPEYVVRSAENRTVLDKNGAAPLFEQLRRDVARTYRLGILTGTLIVLPTDTAQQLDPTVKPLPYDATFAQIRPTDENRARLAARVTQLFERGEIHVLIGTRALLGEGWDAPFLTTLILASRVGSFVSSNQMRGRVIRTYRKQPLKTGNVWHLVCIDPTDPAGGADLRQLDRRCRSFVGLDRRDFDNLRITDGTERFQFPKTWSEETITTFNEKQLRRSTRRTNLFDYWKRAIATGTDLRDLIKVAVAQPVRRYRERVRTLRARQRLTNHHEAMTKWRTRRRVADTVTVVGIGAYVGAFVFPPFWSLPYAVEAMVVGSTAWVSSIFALHPGKKPPPEPIMEYTRTHPEDTPYVDQRMRMAQVLLKTLQISAWLKNDVRLNTYLDDEFELNVELENASRTEQQRFMRGLATLFSPIDNPRYVIETEMVDFRGEASVTFVAVPDIFGDHRKTAERFLRRWNVLLPDGKLHFTRNAKGRKLLLRARLRAALHNGQGLPEREHVWR